MREKTTGTADNCMTHFIHPSTAAPKTYFRPGAIPTLGNSIFSLFPPFLSFFLPHSRSPPNPFFRSFRGLKIPPRFIARDCAFVKMIYEPRSSRECITTIFVLDVGRFHLQRVEFRGGKTSQVSRCFPICREDDMYFPSRWRMTVLLR